MKFFAIIARAVMESRQRQADRIIRDHSYLARYEARFAAEARATDVAATVDLKPPA